jgi:large subunit ribosomal protein L9
MDVILLESIGKLGELGERVSVKPGYGRNYLIPFGKAVAATKENVASFEARRAELEAAALQRRGGAEARAASLEGMSITITANAGDEGKLFGSVGTRDIADAISKAGVDVQKSEIRLPLGAIREVGEYEITVQLHSEIRQTVALNIVAE